MIVGAEGPWTPTELAGRLEMPLSTVLFRVGRLEKRGHVERIPNPDDRRSYLIRLTADGKRLLGQARPRFRAYALAVEARLDDERLGQLRATALAATLAASATRWPTSGVSPPTWQQRDRLDVRRVREHVHRPHALERVAPLRARAPSRSPASVVGLQET